MQAAPGPAPKVSELQQIGTGGNPTGGGNITSDTHLLAGTTLISSTENRPVAEEFFTICIPNAPGPSASTDYHNMDVQLAMNGLNLNANCNAYALECKTTFNVAATMTRLHGALFESVMNNGATATEIYGVKAFNQVLTGSTVTSRSACFWAQAPVIDSSGATVAVSAGLFVQGFATASNPHVTTSLAIYVSDGESRFQDSVVINNGGAALNNAATTGFLYTPIVAGAPTGVPVARGGAAAMCYDTTNNKIWFYNGAWRGVVVA